MKHVMKQRIPTTASQRVRLGLQVLGLAVAALASVATSKGATHEAIYMSWDELRSSARVEPPKHISKRGKIYVHGKLLLVSEPGQGVHVIDNTNPSAPVPRAFIRVPGNLDVAARGNHLYADSAVDLLVFRLHEDPRQIRLVRRMQDVFPYQWRHTLPSSGDRVWPRYPDRNKGAVVGWKRIQRGGWL